MFLGDAGSGNLNPVWRREEKVDWRSVNEEDKGEEERGSGGEESRRGGEGKRRE